MARHRMTENGPVPFTEEEEAEWDAIEAEMKATATDRRNQEIKKYRSAAYAAEADPLFFKVQRNEATMQDWEAKIAEIRARFPYEEPPAPNQEIVKKTPPEKIVEPIFHNIEPDPAQTS